MTVAIYHPKSILATSVFQNRSGRLRKTCSNIIYPSLKLTFFSRPSQQESLYNHPFFRPIHPNPPSQLKRRFSVKTPQKSPTFLEATRENPEVTGSRILESPSASSSIAGDEQKKVATRILGWKNKIGGMKRWWFSFCFSCCCFSCCCCCCCWLQLFLFLLPGYRRKKRLLLLLNLLIFASACSVLRCDTMGIHSLRKLSQEGRRSEVDKCSRNVCFFSCKTSRKTNICPLKRDYFNRKYIFQPLIFSGHVSVQGG